MSIKNRAFSGYTQEALVLLGRQIKVGRKERRWSAQELAQRAGIARDTLQHIERGDAGCAVGLVFEVAALVGVPLFSADLPTLARERSHADSKLALLPKAIRPNTTTTKVAKKTSKHPKEVFVWVWLPDAIEPVVAGKLVPSVTGKSESLHFHYGRSYPSRLEAISLYEPELPLQAGRLPLLGDLTMPGCLRDAAPDAWGRRVLMNRFLGSSTSAAADGQLDTLSLLVQSGSDRIGAFDFQLSPTEYVPRDAESTTLAALQASVERVEKGMPLSADIDQALIYGATIGGSRPKALLTGTNGKYIAKFASTTDQYSVVKAEFIAMRLAQVVGLQVAQVKFSRAATKEVLVVKRFDREQVEGGWRRRSMISALTLFGLDEKQAHYGSYQQLAEIIRHRFTEVAGTLHELFGRLVFNILCGNTDDHARNHAAFWDGHSLSLTPAYDICPQLRISSSAVQAMQISKGNSTSQLATCLQTAHHFLLSEAEALALIEQQLHIIASQWQSLSEEAALNDVEHALLWGRAFLNPFAFEGLIGAASSLSKLGEIMRRDFGNRNMGMAQLLLV